MQGVLKSFCCLLSNRKCDDAINHWGIWHECLLRFSAHCCFACKSHDPAPTPVPAAQVPNMKMNRGPEDDCEITSSSKSQPVTLLIHKPVASALPSSASLFRKHLCSLIPTSCSSAVTSASSVCKPPTVRFSSSLDL